MPLVMAPPNSSAILGIWPTPWLPFGDIKECEAGAVGYQKIHCQRDSNLGQMGVNALPGDKSLRSADITDWLVADGTLGATNVLEKRHISGPTTRQKPILNWQSMRDNYRQLSPARYRHGLLEQTISFLRVMNRSHAVFSLNPSMAPPRTSLL